MCKCLKKLLKRDKRKGKGHLKVGKRYRLSTRSVKKVRSKVYTWYKVCESNNYDKIKEIFDKKVTESGELFEFKVIDKLMDNEVILSHYEVVKEVE